MNRPGRYCPAGYGYTPRVFARPPEVTAETLYVIGGLYGNLFALDEIDRLAGLEVRAPTLLFNGDFHWFDADAALFDSVQRRVLRHVALRGNVETELATADGSAGCGCAYPASVADAEVDRSNAILDRLRDVVAGLPGARAELAGLSAHTLAQVGALRIAIVHGDAWSIAGWRFAHDRLHDADAEEALRAAFEQGAVDGFASSHTCAPALKVLDRRFVINNGAAGMANFEGTTHGLLTRISVHALPPALQQAGVFGLQERGVRIDALRIAFDVDRWMTQFDRLWPRGTPACVSYRGRMSRGPGFTLEDALGRRSSERLLQGNRSSSDHCGSNPDQLSSHPRGKEPQWKGNGCC